MAVNEWARREFVARTADMRAGRRNHTLDLRCWLVSEHIRPSSQEPKGRNWTTVLRGDLCAYCGAPAQQVDHIVPTIAGGEKDWSNRTGACRHCNHSKSDLGPLHYLLALRLQEAIEAAPGHVPKVVLARELWLVRVTPARLAQAAAGGRRG